MKKIALVLALIMVFASVLTACGEKESGGISINKDAQTTSDTQIVSGLSGESYTLSNNITKVVSLSPAASMIIDSLGGSSKLTAVDKASFLPQLTFPAPLDFPPKLSLLTKLTRLL